MTEPRKKEFHEPIKQDTPEGRRERAFLARSHDDGLPKETRLDDAEHFAKIHKKRTGEDVDPKVVAEIEEVDPNARPIRKLDPDEDEE
ncbi:hypothetical protein HK104_002457 [Borealophlyctis nickersoniae]|nr:hypothetical protein HK104_002457 [Borealophlyctis nickersoniae]